MTPVLRSGTLALAAAGCLAGGLLLWPLPLPTAPPAPAAWHGPEPAGAFVAAAPFDPQRRPEPPGTALPVAPGKTAPADPVPLVLSGIYEADGDRRAMFTAAPGAWQATGAMFGGWTISAISPTEVTLQRDGETRVLRYGDALSATGAL